MNENHIVGSDNKLYDITISELINDKFEYKIYNIDDWIKIWNKHKNKLDDSIYSEILSYILINESYVIYSDDKSILDEPVPYTYEDFKNILTYGYAEKIKQALFLKIGFEDQKYLKNLDYLYKENLWIEANDKTYNDPDSFFNKLKNDKIIVGDLSDIHIYNQFLNFNVIQDENKYNTHVFSLAYEYRKNSLEGTWHEIWANWENWWNGLVSNNEDGVLGWDDWKTHVLNRLPEYGITKNTGSTPSYNHIINNMFFYDYMEVDKTNPNYQIWNFYIDNLIEDTKYRKISYNVYGVLNIYDNNITYEPQSNMDCYNIYNYKSNGGGNTCGGWTNEGFDWWDGAKRSCHSIHNKVEYNNVFNSINGTEYRNFYIDDSTLNKLYYPLTTPMLNNNDKILNYYQSYGCNDNISITCNDDNSNNYKGTFMIFDDNLIKLRERYSEWENLRNWQEYFNFGQCFKNLTSLFGNESGEGDYWSYSVGGINIPQIFKFWSLNYKHVSLLENGDRYNKINIKWFNYLEVLNHYKYLNYDKFITFTFDCDITYDLFWDNEHMQTPLVWDGFRWITFTSNSHTTINNQLKLKLLSVHDSHDSSSEEDSNLNSLIIEINSNNNVNKFDVYSNIMLSYSPNKDSGFYLEGSSSMRFHYATSDNYYCNYKNLVSSISDKHIDIIKSPNKLLPIFKIFDSMYRNYTAQKNNSERVSFTRMRTPRLIYKKINIQNWSNIYNVNIIPVAGKINESTIRLVKNPERNIDVDYALPMRSFLISSSQFTMLKSRKYEMSFWYRTNMPHSNLYLSKKDGDIVSNVMKTNYNNFESCTQIDIKNHNNSYISQAINNDTSIIKIIYNWNWDSDILNKHSWNKYIVEINNTELDADNPKLYLNGDYYILFEIPREYGSAGWLEIDDVQLYEIKLKDVISSGMSLIPKDLQNND